MDVSSEKVTAEPLEPQVKVDCCVACLSKDEKNLSNANVTGLLKDFLNREVSFGWHPSFYML